MHAAARDLVELGIPVAKESRCRWPAPVTPETFFEAFSEVGSHLTQEIRDGDKDNGSCSAQARCRAGAMVLLQTMSMLLPLAILLIQPFKEQIDVDQHAPSAADYGLP